LGLPVGLEEELEKILLTSRNTTPLYSLAKITSIGEEQIMSKHSKKHSNYSKKTGSISFKSFRTGKGFNKNFMGSLK
jgi:hypothetical protein